MNKFSPKYNILYVKYFPFDDGRTQKFTKCWGVEQKMGWE